jgi:hypothetical protein
MVIDATIRGIDGHGVEDRTYFKLPEDFKWSGGKWVVLYDVHKTQGNVFEEDGVRWSDITDFQISYLLDQIENLKQYGDSMANVAGSLGADIGAARETNEFEVAGGIEYESGRRPHRGRKGHV